jgi:hypothetical protein
VPEKFGIRRDANATARAQPRSGHRRGQAESEAHRCRRLCTATARVEPLGLAQPSVTTTRYRNKNSSRNRTFHGENGVAPRVSVLRKLRYPTHLPLISGRQNRSIARANSEAEKWTLFWAGCCETLGTNTVLKRRATVATAPLWQEHHCNVLGNRSECVRRPRPQATAPSCGPFAPSRRQETRAGSARPRLRKYAVTRAYFEGRKTASKFVTNLAPSIRFLTWGRKAASFSGPKNGLRIGTPEPSKNGTSRTGNIAQYCMRGVRLKRRLPTRYAPQTSVPRRFG